MNKKNVIIVVVATCCLAMLLMMPLSRSAEPKDPWADVSGTTKGVPDGTINMRDISYELLHFNQDVSNMTRDVNVTNWVNESQDYALINGAVNLSNSNWQVPVNSMFYCGGYSKLSLMIWVTGANLTNSVTFYVRNVQWYSSNSPSFNYGNEPIQPLTAINCTVLPSVSWSGPISFMVDVEGPYVIFTFDHTTVNNSGWYISFNYTVYLRND